MTKILEKTKDIELVIKPPAPSFVGDGFFIHKFFPRNVLIDDSRMSPFWLMDYNAKIEFSPSEKPRGVSVHPHRGMETVSIAYEGKIEHHDSEGNHGIIGEGDVQWMTAGSGILHKEYHEKEFSKKGGFFHMVQLWVNLPSKYKMTKPKYQSLLHENMGKYILENNSGIVNIIAGEYNRVKGPASTFTPINLFDIKLNNKGLVNLSFPENYNTGILIAKGKVKINNSTEITVDNFILFKNEGTNIQIEALEESILLVLNGEPINEPNVPHGPFLMNTVEEIQKALSDFNDGKFGYLED
ncbi:MAG: pirin family protein [Candidatus Sericytochromatia bacterium]